tara:strand:+ start:682 stop:936 length:255 start_codon:yes stop_codon:yes gene_type:complete
MATISELLYMKMDNGEYIYGTNLEIGKYSVEHECECEHEFEHVNPSTLYSKFTWVGEGNNPTNFETQSRYMDYEKGKIVGMDKW